MMIAELTGDSKYSPCSVDGKVGKCTTFALVQVVRSGLAEIPLVSKLVGLLNRIPGVSTVLNNYTAYSYAVDAAELGYEDELMDIYETVRDGIEAVNPILEAVANRLHLPDVPGATRPGMVTMQIAPGVQMQQQQSYPPGTVAVRDPLLGKYILLAP